MAELDARLARARRPKTAPPAPAAAVPKAVVNPLLALQQTVGNQAVQRQVRAGRLAPQAIGGLQRTIGNHAVQRLLEARAIQAKLTVNTPGDAYEQEADRVAAQVMTMPAPAPAVGGTAPSVDRTMQRQTGGTVDGSGEASADLERQIAGLQGRGQPLPSEERSFFEPRFGRDFSGVRVHADSQAADLANAVQARAFTVGSDVAFGAGEYAPGTSSGRELLAHELTHVAQQGAAGEIRRKIEANKLNIVGEEHPESDARRGSEKAMINEVHKFPGNKYWGESEFAFGASGEATYGDNLSLLVAQSASFLLKDFKLLEGRVDLAVQFADEFADLRGNSEQVKKRIKEAQKEVGEFEAAVDRLAESTEGQENKALTAEAYKAMDLVTDGLLYYMKKLGIDYEEDEREELLGHLNDLLVSMDAWKIYISQVLEKMGYTSSLADKPDQLEDQITGERSLHMYLAAEAAVEKSNKTGVWKVGEEHVQDMKGLVSDKTTTTTRADFNKEYEAWKQSKSRV